MSSTVKHFLSCTVKYLLPYTVKHRLHFSTVCTVKHLLSCTVKHISVMHCETSFTLFYRLYFQLLHLGWTVLGCLNYCHFLLLTRVIIQIFYFGVFLMETDILIMFSFLVHAAFQYFLMMFFSDLNLVNDALLVWVWLALVSLYFCLCYV